MGRNVVKGIVTKVESVHGSLSFVTLIPMDDEKWSELTVPVYMKINRDIDGKPVDIITNETGLVWRDVEQEIVGSNFSYSVKLPKSQIKFIT